MTEAQWVLINARISALESLVSACARTSPRAADIRAQFAEDAAHRKSALRLSHMPDEMLEMSMAPFQRLMDALESVDKRA